MPDSSRRPRAAAIDEPQFCRTGRAFHGDAGAPQASGEQAPSRDAQGHISSFSPDGLAFIRVRATVPPTTASSMTKPSCSPTARPAPPRGAAAAGGGVHGWPYERCCSWSGDAPRPGVLHLGRAPERGVAVPMMTARGPAALAGRSRRYRQAGLGTAGVAVSRDLGTTTASAKADFAAREVRLPERCTHRMLNRRLDPDPGRTSEHERHHAACRRRLAGQASCRACRGITNGARHSRARRLVLEVPRPCCGTNSSPGMASTAPTRAARPPLAADLRAGSACRAGPCCSGRCAGNRCLETVELVPQRDHGAARLVVVEDAGVRGRGCQQAA